MMVFISLFKATEIMKIILGLKQLRKSMGFILIIQQPFSL